MSLKKIDCKLSGMITEADHQAWKPADLAPYIRHILKVFGPDRCILQYDEFYLIKIDNGFPREVASSGKTENESANFNPAK